MALTVSDAVANSIPSSVKTALAKMPDEQQSIFEEEYSKKMKNPTMMLLLAIFFPIQHFLLGQAGLGILFWVTLGGMGIWYIIEIFKISGSVKQLNEDTAKGLLRDMKIMGS